MPVHTFKEWAYATGDSIDMLRRLSTDKEGSNAWTHEYWQELDFVPKYAFYRLFLNVIGNNPQGCIEWVENNCIGKSMAIYAEAKSLHMFFFELDDDAAMFKLTWGDF